MNDETIHPRGTTARTPDLSWSQVRETVLMLELAAVQIEAAMKDSDTSVDVLTKSFTTMAGYMRVISDTVQTLPDEGAVGIAKQNLSGVSDHVSSMVHQAIIAFQFYDKLVQRLAHVGISLGDLSTLVADNKRLFNPGEWVGLQDKIRSKYSTREEIAMFEAVMQGMPVQEAVDNYMAEMKEKSDDIELF
ncbi:hypothetical protein [Dechloromonas sp. HYN0024]|uniref:hypothetical protein n=1 Tax=Dechloromonas sp. HYN0024 TaxID=2231055 RepID=UPI000E43347A|nr:hypothetical protein [Dechloromonas sp. HYN0024]AXS78594.1 hypothetical protein HYN24_00195 [Dechloromonas sp. HYN0024]